MVATCDQLQDGVYNQDEYSRFQVISHSHVNEEFNKNAAINSAWRFMIDQQTIDQQSVPSLLIDCFDLLTE